MLKEWKITYFNKGNVPADDGQTFGCSVDGIAGHTGSMSASWSISPLGEVLFGTCETVLHDLNNLLKDGYRPDAAVVFFAKSEGAEYFLRHIGRLLPDIPWGGGGAATQPETGMGELIPSASEVSLLLICDYRYQFKNIWMNVHADTGRRVAFRASSSRTILAIRAGSKDHPALNWFLSELVANGYQQDCFENLALASSEGWNLHTLPEGDFALRTGADLPNDGELVVRITDRPHATQKMSDFCAGENMLVFGCAGLMSLLDEPINPGENTLTGFLHGEVLCVDHRPRWTNLMMSALLHSKEKERNLYES